MDFLAITSGLRAYEMDAGSPPTTAQGLAALVRKPTEPPLPKRWKAEFKPERIKDRWGREYQYRQPGVHNPDSFDLWSLGQDGVPSDDDIGNWKKEYESDDGSWIWWD